MSPQPSKRQALIEGALRCLQERGYAHTTARDITAAADANLASIGYHFGSKERLLAEALNEAFNRWLDPLIERAARTGEDDPVHQLAAGLTEFLSSLEANRPLIVASLEALAQAERSAELRRQMAEGYQRFRETIARTVRSSFGERGERMGIDPEAVASLVIAVSDGLVIQWLLDPERAPGGARLLDSAMAAVALSLSHRQPA